MKETIFALIISIVIIIFLATGILYWLDFKNSFKGKFRIYKIIHCGVSTFVIFSSILIIGTYMLTYNHIEKDDLNKGTIVETFNIINIESNIFDKKYKVTVNKDNEPFVIKTDYVYFVDDVNEERAECITYTPNNNIARKIMWELKDYVIYITKDEYNKIK